MNSYFLLIIGAAIIPNFVQGFSIPTNVSATNVRLWSLDNSATDFTNKVNNELTKYAKYCCTIIHKKSENECNRIQMGYWGRIFDRLTTEAEKLTYLRDNFDPEKQTELTIRNSMCDCNGKQNPETKRCDPISKNDKYPYFSFPTGTNKIHSEQRLLPVIKIWAENHSNDNDKSTFYLYSYNSPCSCDPTQTQSSCIFKIMEATANSLYKDNKIFHKMKAVFKMWYLWEKNVREKPLLRQENIFAVRSILTKYRLVKWILRMV